MSLARLLAACLLALLLTTSPRLAGAALMRHHDLTSLALDSEAVVLARRIRSEGPDHDRLAHHEVLKVYRGTLAVGDQVAVSYGSYDLEPNRFRRDDTPPAVQSDEVVLFLKHWPGRSEWSITPSGLRILLDGRVHRFEQWDNPGLYHPVPQRRDPYDVMLDPRAGDPLDLPAFEQELTRALRHADVVRHALTDTSSPAGKQRLLDLIGPAPGTWDDRPFAPSHTGFWEDQVATRILETLATTGALTDLLMATARIRGGVSMFMLEHPYKPAELLAHASTPTAPPPQRVAALALLSEMLATRNDPQIVAGAIRLLADPDPTVRGAAARIPFETAAWKTAILDRFTIETDGGARHELARAADTLNIFEQLHLPDSAPLLLAERRGGWLQLRWLPYEWRVEHITLRIEEPGHAPQRTVLMDHKRSDSTSSWSQGRTTGLDVPLGLTPQPGAPSPTQLVAELTMHLDGHKKPRTFSVAVPTLAAVPTPIFPDPPPATATTPTTTATTTPNQPPPSHTPAPASAVPPGCTILPAPTTPSALVVLLLLVHRRRPRARAPHLASMS